MSAAKERGDLRLRHARIGWWGLLVFLALGLFLEALNGFKIGWYLDVTSSTRRHMWTLAHAHGTLVSLVNIVWAGAGLGLAGWTARRQALASSLLAAGTVLLPGGFLLGGVFIHQGDPGQGILLVPVGALALLAAVLLTATSARG